MVSDVAGCALTHVEEERVSAEDVLFIQLLEDESFNAEELAGPDEMSPAVVGLMPVNRGDKQSAKIDENFFPMESKGSEASRVPDAVRCANHSVRPGGFAVARPDRVSPLVIAIAAGVWSSAKVQ
ncbi:hypothetical protein quinque_002652 [Culex quinquefasciatus]